MSSQVPNIISYLLLQVLFQSENEWAVVQKTPWTAFLLSLSCLSSRLSAPLTTVAVNMSPIAISGRKSTPFGIQRWVIFNPPRTGRLCEGARLSKMEAWRGRASWKPVLSLLKSRNAK